MSKKIMIVENDPDISQLLNKILTDEGYLCLSVSEGAKAISLIEQKQFDLILLDLHLPDIRGADVCRQIKKAAHDLPVIALFEKGSAHQISTIFNIGADDYIVKPINVTELLTRVSIRLRGLNGSSRRIIIGDLQLDKDSKQVFFKKDNLGLTAQEFRLLEHMMNHAGRTLSRDNILYKLWNYGIDVQSRVVDVYIGYLRKKIDKTYGSSYIRTVRGFGYMLAKKAPQKDLLVN